MYCDQTDIAAACATLRVLIEGMEGSAPATAKAIREAAKAAALPVVAIDLLIAATSWARHVWRVGAARDAARAWATSLLHMEEGVLSTPWNAAGSPQFLLEQALAACVADMVGIGGGVGSDWGAASARHPAFAGCGSGRKQARDGGAWSAAILEAAHRLQAELRELRLAAGVAPELASTLDAADFIGGCCPVWDASVAGLALLVCLGASTHEQRALLAPWVDIDADDARAWAEALQEAREEIEKAAATAASVVV